MSRNAGKRVSAFEARGSAKDDNNNADRESQSRDKHAYMKQDKNESKRSKRRSEPDKEEDVIDITKHDSKEIEKSAKRKNSEPDQENDGQHYRRRRKRHGSPENRSRSAGRDGYKSRRSSNGDSKHSEQRKISGYQDKNEAQKRNKQERKGKERIEVDSSDSPVICLTDSSEGESFTELFKTPAKGRNKKDKYKASEDPTSSNRPEPDTVRVVGSSLSWYTMKVADGALVVLPHPSEYVFGGKATVHVLVGKVAVQGYLLHSGNPATIYSPDCNSLLTIKTVQSENSINKAAVKVTKSFNIGESKLSGLRSALKKFESFVLVHVKAAEPSACDEITRWDPYTQLFEVADEYDVTDLNQVLARLGATLMPGGDMPRLEVTEDLENIIQLWAGKGEMPSSILLCGGKDSGKSTTNRLLLNTVLNSGSDEPLYYLDCDVGQAEFTPAGCVSLVKVTDPLLGPAFCNQKEPVVSCSFHGVSPKDDPDRYLACVRHCVQRYQQLETPGRLVVNTMGWMTGLGSQLLVDIVNLVQPHYVVQLTSPQRNQNIAPLTQNFLQGTSWSDLSTDVSSEPVKRNPQYQPQIQHMDVAITPRLTSKFTAADHRNLGLLTHLCSNLEPGMTLTSVHPYCVPWRDVAVHVCHSDVPRSQVMYALNASLVALCRADVSKATRDVEDGPQFFKRLPVCEWLGYGIVRGIDPEKKLMYIITSLPVDKLDQVNTVVKGTVAIPDTLLLNQSCDELAYVDEPKQSKGASSVRPRRHMPRKYLGPVS